MHATDVAVVQLLVEQSPMATTAVTVASVGAKFMPLSVMLATSPNKTLYGDADEMIGPVSVAFSETRAASFNSM